jgi:hypothetical protein
MHQDIYITYIFINQTYSTAAALIIVKAPAGRMP